MEKTPFLKRLPIITKDSLKIVKGVLIYIFIGIPLGTAIAFMMAIIGLSIPEATMLKKVMTWRLIGIFFGVVSLLIVISGYLFYWIL